MDAHELARWTRFAAKGGIGKCTAIVDCIAQEMGEDLMFLKDDEITVLMQLPEPGIYLGHCEGVVGRFSGKDVRFHGKLKKPVMAKRASVTVGLGGSESRTSIPLMQGRSSRTEPSGEGPRHASESPSDSRPGSRAKRTPSPSRSKSRTSVQSYSTSHSRLSEDQSQAAMPDDRSMTLVGTLRSPNVNDSRIPSMKLGHAKPPQMAISTSGASVFSVGSASVYSEASTATSVYSSGDAASRRTRSRQGSIYSVNSCETEKDVPGEGEYGNVHQADGASPASSPSVSISAPSKSPSGSAAASNMALPTSISNSSSISASSSTSGASFSSTSTYGSDTANGSLGSISELEAKQIHMRKFSVRSEVQTSFILVPPPLGIGDGRTGPSSPSVAPLRVNKPPRLTPSPGIPPSSPLPVPPASSGDNSRSTPISPALSSPLSPGMSVSLSPRPPTSGSLASPGSLSPGSAAGPRSPGLPGSLYPGVCSPLFPHATKAQSQYTSSASSSSSSSPLPSFTSSPTSLTTGANANGSSTPSTRSPPASSPLFGASQPYGAPLSPPPSSPLPPLPSAPSIPSPALPATVGANGRTSPASPPSSSPERRLGGNGGVFGDELGDEAEEGDTTRLLTLDEFRRQLNDSEDEEEQALRLGGSKEAQERRASGDSDGEVGIGLSLMGALGDDEDEDIVEPAKKARERKDGKAGMGDVGGNVFRVSLESGGTAPMTWTRYTPTSPISPQSANWLREEEDADEDDGAYWDDIYDDYRYSRYSLASKRFSAASKASGVSKASSRVRTHAPPMPMPPDRPSVDVSRPSTGSDGAMGYPRPSLESASSTMSASMPFTRPPLSRSTSEDSTHETNVLPLTAQFPAVPAHVPVRTESRLRIVHDGYTSGGDDHAEREQQVEHGSTEEESRVVGLNIEVIEAAEEEGNEAQCQEAVVGRPFTFANAQTALSPLLHTTFGSPHSSRFTDLEDGSSDQDHARRYSNKSGKSMMSSVEGPSKSPIESGGMASALRARMEAERTSPSGTASSSLGPTSDPNALSSEEPSARAIVVDDDERRITSVSNAISDPILATEVGSPLPIPSTQIPSVSQATVVTDSAQATCFAERPDDAEKAPFLRPRPQASQKPHPFARTSIFLPHPNAPTVVYQSQGPMYGRTAPQPYTYPISSSEVGSGGSNATTQPPAATPPGTTLYSTHILHQLRNLSIAAVSQGSAARRRPMMTVFARCQPDLNASMGPVPIVFSLDPFPAGPAMPQASRLGGGGSGVGAGSAATPMRAATVSAPVRDIGAREGVPANERGSDVGGMHTLRLPRRSATSVYGPQGTDASLATPSSPSLPIPREGFVPQVGAARPRSRSFSAFGANGPFAALQEKSREEPVMKAQGVPSAIAPARKASLPPALTPRHALSPLVLPNGNRTPSNVSLSSPVVQSPQIKVPPSPLAQELLTLFVDANGPLTSPLLASSPFLNGSDRDKAALPASAPARITSGMSMSSSDPRTISPPHALMPGRQGSSNVPPRSNSTERPLRRSSDSSDSRSLASPPPIPEATSQSARSSPLVQEIPLRTKLSLPALRMKANIRSKVDDAVSVASLAGSGENETVQVQDMDFELVKPSLPQVTSGGRASQDSTLTSRELEGSNSPTLGDGASMYSSAPRSPLTPAFAKANAPAVPEFAESIDAHRQRELKWMALFPTVPASQARKNKKVRKLLQEGVPSSVRYLVWCHLTDSKARALPGVYGKLVKRPRVPAFAEIERDMVQGFPDQPQLHTAQGPLVSLLQAYLTMVPDIQYDNGLTLIAGHLLLLAPEEDAFWIFTSMMDAHLRAYFSANTVQIEIDASLFSKALESTDPVLTKKLYVQLSIAPASITRPWYSTLFVGSLSVDYLHRVWDIFLYDGIPYLFRIGLVLMNCVRHLLLQATTEEAALAYLVRPPPACLPSANELLALAANVKLKDDDVRKQRIKMEQQLKRTTQARPPNGMTNVQTATISLPKP